MPLQAICMTVCLFLAQVAADTGVQFVMERHPDSYFCGHLQCVADLTNSGHSVFSLIEMTIYDITRVNWELKLASVSAFHPDLYVDTTKSSAMSCAGIISRLQANLTLQLRHDIDCLYGVYKCQLDFVTESGHPEVLTEIVVPEINESYTRVSEMINHIDTLTGLFNSHTTQVSNQTIKINYLESQLDHLTTQVMNQTMEINNLQSHEDHQTTYLTDQTDQIHNLGSQLDDLTTKLADQTALLHNISQRHDLEQTEQKQMHNAVMTYLKTLEVKLETRQQPATQITNELTKQVPCYRGMPNTDHNRTIINLWNKTMALCDTQTDGGGWVVILKYTEGSVTFHRTWDSYKNGFGYPNTDYWIGNDIIHDLTSQGFSELRIDIKERRTTHFLQVRNFSVADEQSNYRTVFGEMFGNNRMGDLLQTINGSIFMTYDRASKSNCPSYVRFGFWFGEHHCMSYGVYDVKLPTIEMKVRHA